MCNLSIDKPHRLGFYHFRAQGDRHLDQDTERLNLTLHDADLRDHSGPSSAGHLRPVENDKAVHIDLQGRMSQG
jgi:hypothetical protein